MEKERKVMKKMSVKVILFTTLALLLVGCSSGEGEIVNSSDSYEVDQSAGSEPNEEAEEANPNQHIELQTVIDSIKGAYGDTYYPNVSIEEIHEMTNQGESLEELIQDTYGIATDLYEEIFIEVPMISGQSDMLIAMKVAEGKQQEAVDILTAYREGLVNDAIQYPMTQVKLQASQVIEKEGFVFLVRLGDIPMEVEEQGDEALIEKALEVNQIAVEAINAVLQ